MGGGLVLDFTNSTFGALFRRYKVEIDSDKYQSNGPSKAKRMRSFCENDPDALVGRVLIELLDTYEANCDLGGREIDKASLAKCREIVARLLGKPPVADSLTSEGFLRNL